MIKTNKKVIYLSVFLVLGLFLISACTETVGKKIAKEELYEDDGGVYNLKVGQSATVNEVKITLIDVGSEGGVIVNEKVIESGKISTVSSLINPFKENQYYASVDVTNIKAYYTEKKSDRSATLKIVKSSPENLAGFKYNLKVGEGVTLKNVELVDVGSEGGVIVSLNKFVLLDDDKTAKITDSIGIGHGETKIINNFVIKNIQASYNEIKGERRAVLEIRQL